MEMKMRDAYEMRERKLEQKRKEKVRHPLSGEPVGLGSHDKSLHDIFEDRREAELLLLYLHKRNPRMAKEIAKRRAEQPAAVLTEAQEKFLEESREPFNILRAQSDLLKEILSPERLKHMSRADKDIDEVIGMIGEAGAAAFLADHIGETAVQDEARFGRIIESLKAAHEIQNSKEAEYRERRILGLLQKYNVSKEGFEDATIDGSTYEGREKLAQMAGTQLTGWRKALDFVTFGKVADWRAGKLQEAYEAREALLNEADEHLAPVIKVLRATLMSEDVRRAYQNIGFGEGVMETPKYTVATIKDFQRLKKDFDLDKAAADFKRYRAEEAKKFPAKKVKVTNNKGKQVDQNQARFWDSNGQTNLEDPQKQKIVDTFLSNKKAKREEESARGLMKLLVDDLFANYDADLEAKVRSTII